MINDSLEMNSDTEQNSENREMPSKRDGEKKQNEEEEGEVELEEEREEREEKKEDFKTVTATPAASVLPSPSTTANNSPIVVEKSVVVSTPSAPKRFATSSTRSHAPVAPVAPLSATATATTNAIPIRPINISSASTKAVRATSVRATTITLDSEQQVRFTRSYVFSLDGLLRLTLILSQFAGWVSAAAVAKSINGMTYLPPELASTRDAYLFFSVSGFFIALTLYLFYLFNVNNVGPFPSLPLNLIIIVHDLVWLVATFILAIVCAVREAGTKNPLFFYHPFVNTGAFASAAFFGFLSSLIYGIDALIHVYKQMKTRSKK